MKAIRLDRLGPPSVLQYLDVPPPTPEADEVLVRVEAAGVNYAEAMQRAGTYPVPLPLPVVLGSEVAGTIVSVGRDVRSHLPGARVVAPLLDRSGAWRRGGYAELVTAPADHVLQLPEGVSVEQSVALLSQGITAYAMLHRAVPLTPGQTILVHGAAGGVGSLLVQLAKVAGAGLILGTEVTAEKAAHLAAIGVDAAIDISAEEWPEQVMALMEGRGVDVVVDSLGGREGRRSLACLAPFGRLVTYGTLSGHYLELGPNDVERLIFRNQQVIGFGNFAFFKEARQRLEVVAQLLALASAGALRPLTTVFALRDAEQAHLALETHRAVGKVVLRP